MALYNVGYDDVFHSFVGEWAVRFGAGAQSQIDELYDYCDSHDKKPFRMNAWKGASASNAIYIGRYLVPGGGSLCVSASIDVPTKTVIFIALSAQSYEDDWELAGKPAERNSI